MFESSHSLFTVCLRDICVAGSVERNPCESGADRKSVASINQLWKGPSRRKKTLGSNAGAY